MWKNEVTHCARIVHTYTRYNRVYHRELIQNLFGTRTGFFFLGGGGLCMFMYDLYKTQTRMVCVQHAPQGLARSIPWRRPTSWQEHRSEQGLPESCSPPRHAYPYPLASCKTTRPITTWERLERPPKHNFKIRLNSNGWVENFYPNASLNTKLEVSL